MRTDWYTIGVALFAAIGTFLFVSSISSNGWEPFLTVTQQGFDTGIATTTIAHQSWVSYMGTPTTAQTGAVRLTPFL
jgi:hypothetical protein